MTEWPKWRDAGCLQKMAAGNGWFVKFWEDMFNATHDGQIDTWDYQRLFTMWRHNAVSIMPAHNMVANFGLQRFRNSYKRKGAALGNTTSAS